MAANTAPIYSLTPNISGVEPTAANTNSDGTGIIGSNMFKAYTAGTNGSYVSVIRWAPVSEAASTATTATVGRIFISSISSGTTSPGVNIWLLAEYGLASQTADSPSTATFFIEVPVYKALPAGWCIMVTNHAASAANTAWQAVVYGGDY
ncbi:MAG TPA: hypothetical protein VMR95_02690 [Candidatus Binatia bacterium]|nr:hypothetical protein [Candidatus Binatia bacterium]